MLDAIAEIQHDARAARLVADGDAGTSRPAWPMIVLRTPKGWTGPKVVDGLPVEGTFRSHQVPLAATRTNAGHRAQLETWMRSVNDLRLVLGTILDVTEEEPEGLEGFDVRG